MANIALVDADGRGSLLAWPDGHALPAMPYVSTDGFAAIANMSMIGVDDDGEFRVRTLDADMDVIVDVMGVCRATDTAVAAGRVIPIDPYRAYDTRTDDAADGPLGERELRTISVADPALPADATGVVVTFTVANTTAENTWFSVLPGDWDLNDDGCPNPVGEMLPCTSTLNIQANDRPDAGPQSRANQVPVLVSLDQFKQLQVYALHGGDVVVDVTAYVTGPTSPTSEEGLYIQMLRPAPIWTATFTAADATASHQVAGASGIPQDAIGVTGIIALRADERAHATVHPAHQTTPETSTVNAREGEYLHGHYTTALSPTGELSVHSPFEANATLSLTGYYTGSIPEPAEPGEYEPAVLAYDAQQRLIETQSATGATTGYGYWPDGSRAAQHHPNGTTTLYLGATDVTVAADGAVETATRMYTHAGVLVAARTDNGGLEWLFGNHQGSITTTVTDGNPETRWYGPYGNVRGPAPADPPTTRGFLAQHEDPTGLTYLNNRYHDAVLGVFISVDPMVTETHEPYIYGAANPITYSDPTGLDPDTSSTIQYKSFEYCVGGDARCGGESIRRLYTRFRYTSRAQAIHATLDVTYQQDWSELDGYVSDKDLEYGAQAGGVGVLYLLGGDVEASQVVARVAAAFVGSDGWSDLAGEPGIGTVGIFGSVCIGICVAGGVLKGGGGASNWFLSVGELGASVSVGIVTTSKDACEQRGWSLGGDIGEVVVGGRSVAADPLPNDAGQLWDVDWGNSQTRLAAGGGLPAGGGPAYTWVRGC